MSAVIAALIAVLASPPSLTAGCDAAPRHYTEVEVAAAFETADEAARRLGASERVRAALAAVGRRESSGRAGVWHTLGRDELGAGMHGISIRWHGWRVPAGESLCDPATSARVVLSIWRRAARRGSISLLDAQRVFAGRLAEVGRPVSHPRDRAWCSRLSALGIDCHVVVSREEFGAEPRPFSPPLSPPQCGVHG